MHDLTMIHNLSPLQHSCTIVYQSLLHVSFWQVCPYRIYHSLPPGSSAKGPVGRADQKARGASCLWVQDCRGPLTFPRREAKTCTPCPPKYMKPFAWDGFVQKIMKRYSLHFARLLHHLAPPSNLSISSKTVSSFSLLTLQWLNEAWDRCDQLKLTDTGTLKCFKETHETIQHTCKATKHSYKLSVLVWDNLHI